MAKAIVIGAGIAGIASALRLRKKGYEVEVYEANAYAGGKIHAIESAGFRFDAGPSLFTMPHLVDELFQLFELNPKDYFNYKAKSTICNYFWEDGTRFSAKADTSTFIKNAAATFNVSANELQEYLDKNRQKYELTAGIFLEKSLHKLSTYISKESLYSVLQMAKLDITKSLHQVNAQKFDNPHLVQLFDRYATYNGSSPYQTPGIMSLIPHLEMHFGTYYPQGGMHSISQSLFSLAQQQGVQFFFEQPVQKIIHQKGKAIGIALKDGQKKSADVIVSNMDIFSTYKSLLKDSRHPRRILRQERSSSALIFYWGIKGTYPELNLHNILFSDDYSTEFNHIFEKKSIYQDPTIYLNITAKEEEHAPAGCENWFVMINTPGNFGQDWDTLKKQARGYIIEKIKRVLKIDIESLLVFEAVLDPVKIESETSSHRGSLYGASSNSKFAAFLRHPNFSSNLKNLYFCGGSVHPGGGIPLCLLSAKIVADLIPDSATN